MPNESHTTHVDSRERATTPATSTEPRPRPDLRSMELEAADGVRCHFLRAVLRRRTTSVIALSPIASACCTAALTGTR